MLAAGLYVFLKVPLVAINFKVGGCGGWNLECYETNISKKVSFKIYLEWKKTGNIPEDVWSPVKGGDIIPMQVIK